jgi:hypothetical protein
MPVFDPATLVATAAAPVPSHVPATIMAIAAIVSAMVPVVTTPIVAIVTVMVAVIVAPITLGIGSRGNTQTGNDQASGSKQASDLHVDSFHPGSGHDACLGGALITQPEPTCYRRYMFADDFVAVRTVPPGLLW